MPKLRVRNSWRQLRVALAVLTVAAVAALAVWPSAAALDCEGVALDDGCLFTITGGDTPDPDDGYAVTNADGVPLYGTSSASATCRPSAIPSASAGSTAPSPSRPSRR